MEGAIHVFSSLKTTSAREYSAHLANDVIAHDLLQILMSIRGRLIEASLGLVLKTWFGSQIFASPVCFTYLDILNFW